MHRIRQVATHLGYQEPQILEVFKNTFPTRLHWVLFLTMDLRQAVDTAKRILTKEKIDRQVAGQTSLIQQESYIQHGRWHRTKDRQADSNDG